MKDKTRCFHRVAGTVAAVLILTTLASSQSVAQSEESLARFCITAGSIWLNRDKDYIPTFVGDSQPHRDMESYWRHSFQGVSVPIPMDTEGWHFSIIDSRTVRNMAILSNASLQIRFVFAPSLSSLAVRRIGEIAVELGLPASNLSSIDLVRLALKIDPEEVQCDSDDVQSTVNEFTAVSIKALTLSHHDKIYLHGGGVLGHSVYENSESWTYVFEGIAPGSLFEITVRNESSGRYPYIGFEIADKTLSDSLYSPPWMSAYFETASEPTKDRLLGLRELISDYSLSEETYQNLDEKLAQYK